jgi:beta-lactamase class A
MHHSWTRAASAAVVLVAVAAAGPARADEVRARAEVERLIRESGAEVAVAFRTIDRPGGTPPRLELYIDPDGAFHAASTMKVPVMIELFRQAAVGEASLDERLPVVNEFHSIVDGNPYALSAGDDSEAELYTRVGTTMTLRALCEPMITVSSNFATNLLIERLGARAVQRTVRDLGADGMHVLRGVEDTKAFEQGMNNSTTARALMILLDRIAREEAVDAASSREMLAILLRQQFNDGIPAGLPAGTRVAHKTGSITKINHDAAIVLGPNPFILVVLVRGLEDEKQSKALMASITRVLYGEAQGAPGQAGTPGKPSAGTR